MHNLGLQGFRRRLAYAKTVNKWFWFTGYACANGRWKRMFGPDKLYWEQLQNGFVPHFTWMIKLEMPTEGAYVVRRWVENDRRRKKNLDHENKFNNNAQPYYAIVNTEGKSFINRDTFLRKNLSIFWIEGSEKFVQKQLISFTLNQNISQKKDEQKTKSLKHFYYLVAWIGWITWLNGLALDGRCVERRSLTAWTAWRERRLMVTWFERDMVNGRFVWYRVGWRARRDIVVMCDNA
jgi:hypothetical protein